MTNINQFVLVKEEQQM